MADEPETGHTTELESEADCAPDEPGRAEPASESARPEPHQPESHHPEAKPHERAGAAAAYAAARQSAPPKSDAAAEQDAVAVPVSNTGTGPRPDASTDQPPRSDLDDLAAKAEKADEYLLIAQRTQADFENYRKRAARDAALARDRGVAKLAKELLPAIDNLDRALQAANAYASGPAGPDAETAEVAAVEAQLADGLRLVHAEVLAALARVGIEPFSPMGEPFDPTVHEAVAQQPVQGAASGTVAEVFQQGYRLGETVLRPARVLVAA